MYVGGHVLAIYFLFLLYCNGANTHSLTHNTKFSEEVTFIVSVGTADYCGQVIANVDVFGTLSVYSDASHLIEKHMWNHLLRAVAYFKASFTSPSVSLFLVRLDSATATVHFSSGWVNTVTLYTAGAATALGTTVEFTVPAPYLTDVYFEFDVALLFDTLGAPVNSTMTITATCTISFSSGQGKRNIESARLIASQHLRRLGSNTRTLHTDTTLYLGAQQQQTGIDNPLDREGEEQLGSEPQGPSFVLLPDALKQLLGQGVYLMATVLAMLVMAYLIALIIKQFGRMFLANNNNNTL